MKRFLLIVFLASFVLTGLACDPSFNDYICKNGQVWLVPSDNHSGSEWMGKGDAICVKKVPDVPSGFTNYTTSSSMSNSMGCAYFNDAESCHYRDCPDCVVLQCNQDDEVMLSDVSCYDYYMDRENENILLKDL